MSRRHFRGTEQRGPGTSKYPNSASHVPNQYINQFNRSHALYSVMAQRGPGTSKYIPLCFLCVTNQCNKSLALLVLHWVAAWRRGVPKVTHTADSACYVPNRVNKSLARSLFYTGLRLGFLYSQYYTDIFTHLDILPVVQFSRSQATTCSATTHLANVCKLLPHRSAVFSNPYYRKNQPQGLAHLQATKAPKCPFGPNMLP